MNHNRFSAFTIPASVGTTGVTSAPSSKTFNWSRLTIAYSLRFIQKPRFGTTEQWVVHLQPDEHRHATCFDLCTTRSFTVTGEVPTNTVAELYVNLQQVVIHMKFHYFFSTLLANAGARTRKIVSDTNRLYIYLVLGLKILKSLMYLNKSFHSRLT